MITALLVMTACTSEPIAPDSTRPGSARLQRIAEQYAPIVLQETDPRCPKCDLITKFNYDGNYRGDDNWDHLADVESVPAYVYFAVTETTSHFFISYYFFHPRDWGVEHGPVDVPISNHENDLEGVMLLVERSLLGEPGNLLSVETQGHNQYYQFDICPPTGDEEEQKQVTSGHENLDGCVLTLVEDGEQSCDRDGGGCLPDLLENGAGILDGHHAVVLIESNGHGVSACTNSGIARPLNVSCRMPSTSQGIVYIPGPDAGLPLVNGGVYEQAYPYQLIAMEAGSLPPGSPEEDQGFWFLRNDIGDERAFASWGVLRGDRDTGGDMTCGVGASICQQNAALAPWVWNDPNDGPVHAGDWFCDPAYTFSAHLDGPFEDNYGYSYLEPYYYTHALTIDSLQVNRTDCDSGGDDCDVFIVVRTDGARGSGLVVDRNNWLVDNMLAGEWVGWNHGSGTSAGALEDVINPRNTRWICRQGGSRTQFQIQVYDADSANRDDLIGRLIDLRGPFPALGLEEMTLGDAQIRLSIQVKDVQPPPPGWLERLRNLIQPNLPTD